MEAVRGQWLGRIRAQKTISSPVTTPLMPPNRWLFCQRASFIMLHLVLSPKTPLRVALGIRFARNNRGTPMHRALTFRIRSWGPGREAPPRRSYACAVTVAAPRRARLMRALSADLMEAGADFTQGITLPDAPGGLRIAPSPERNAVVVESDDPATARRYAELAGRLAERDGSGAPAE